MELYEPQPQVPQFSQEQVREVQKAFMSRTYAWMTLALTITGFTAMYIANSPTLIMAILSNKILFYGLIIGELLLVGWLSGFINRTSVTTASAVFLLYSVLNGVTLSVLFMIYTSASIASTFFITAGTFAVMSFVGYTTRTDLSRLGSILFMFLIGIIIASVVNIFLASSTLYWLVTYAGVALFVGLIAYDTQKLKEMSLSLMGNGQTMQKMSILGALTLYLDFINLFIFLLRIFGRRR
jgi:FtsH-binding integral membrane protein